METLSYDSRAARPFPWRSVWATIALTLTCVLALIILPITLLGLSPFIASSSMAIVFFICLFVTFRSALKSRQVVTSAGYRFCGAMILLIPVLLAPLAVVDTSIVMPLLAKRFLVATTFEQERRIANSFHLVLLTVNNIYLETDEYPHDLGVLLQTKDAKLTDLFPRATPDDLNKLRRMATETRPFTPKELEYIQNLANVEYHPIDASLVGKSKDYLILSTRVPDGGYQFLGYSSGRLERVIQTDAEQIIAESKLAATTASQK